MAIAITKFVAEDGTEWTTKDQAIEQDRKLDLREFFKNEDSHPSLDQIIDRILDHREELINVLGFCAPVPLCDLDQAGLTKRETEVFKLVVTGATNRDISNATGLKEQSIKNLVSVIMRKLKVKNRSQITVLAYTGKM